MERDRVKDRVRQRERERERKIDRVRERVTETERETEVGRGREAEKNNCSFAVEVTLKSFI